MREKFPREPDGRQGEWTRESIEGKKVTEPLGTLEDKSDFRCSLKEWSWILMAKEPSAVPSERGSQARKRDGQYHQNSAKGSKESVSHNLHKVW